MCLLLRGGLETRGHERKTVGPFLQKWSRNRAKGVDGFRMRVNMKNVQAPRFAVVHTQVFFNVEVKLWILPSSFPQWPLELSPREGRIPASPVTGPILDVGFMQN